MTKHVSNLVSFSVNFAIDGVKWFERQALQISPVNNLLKYKGKALAESIGVILHCPGDPEWTEQDTRRVLAACREYDKLVHLRIHNDKEFFTRLVNRGSMGCGDAYMDEIWDEVYGGGEDISEAIKRLSENNIFELYWTFWNRGLDWVQTRASSLRTNELSLFQDGKEHYVKGLDLFEYMLDPWMQYTCGYWAHADNLNDAQVYKMVLIAKKLDLKPGLRLLDINCGYGKLCKFLAKNYGVKCVGLTLSKEKEIYAKKTCKGLSVQIKLQDYRHLNEKFDRIVSVEMFQHVDSQNRRSFFKLVERSLNKDGIFLLQTVGRNHINLPPSEPWLQTYVFPKTNLPSAEDITRETAGLFVIEDWHNFSLDYAKTLYCWRENFMMGWPSIRHRYGDRFYRMWMFYLSGCRGLFLAKRVQLWQLVLSKDGIKRDYRAVR